MTDKAFGAPVSQDGLSRVGKMDHDVMENGDPETALHEIIRHLRWRANCEASVARELRREAADARDNADAHSERAEGFLQMASVMERMPVVFPAPPIEAPIVATSSPEATAPHTAPSSPRSESTSGDE